ncbi:cysteine-rich venom protein-like isoform X2 [Pleurodeles waltl]|uniref:cysteine-rich venom protein-like isoform X2 n=1 Tax=Pleurodeles waltl TaxID=8319 RepID=UPI00370950AE
MSQERALNNKRGAQQKGMGFLALVTALLALVFQTSTGQQIILEIRDTSNEDVQEEIVNTLNQLRRSVNPQAQNMLKLRWSDDAAAVALVWIRKCHFGHHPVRMRPVNATLCSELLYKTYIPHEWTTVIDEWFNQKDNFTYGVGEQFNNAQVGDYTQMVWALSHQVGCHVAFCGTDFMYSCSFCPAGNDHKRMASPYEAGKPCGRCPNYCDDGLCTNPCIYKDNYVNCEELKHGCHTDPIIKDGCKATCKCTTEIK